MLGGHTAENFDYSSERSISTLNKLHRKHRSASIAKELAPAIGVFIEVTALLSLDNRTHSSLEMIRIKQPLFSRTDRGGKR